MPIIEELLNQESADIKQPDNDGNYPIHKICEHKSYVLLQKVLNMETDVNVTNADGQTALHIASSKNWIDGVKLLLSKGADTQIADNQKRKPGDLTEKEEILSLL